MLVYFDHGAGGRGMSCGARSIEVVSGVWLSSPSTILGVSGRLCSSRCYYGCLKGKQAETDVDADVDVKCRMRDVGCGMWDVGCRTQDVGCRVWGCQSISINRDLASDVLMKEGAELLEAGTTSGTTR